MLTRPVEASWWRDDEGLVLRTIRAVLKDKGTPPPTFGRRWSGIRRYPALVVLDELPPLTGDGVIAGSPTASPGGQPHRRGLGVTLRGSRGSRGSAAWQSRSMVTVPGSFVE